MFNSKQFFIQRFSSHMLEVSRYLKYIFNGHLVFAMLFLVSALAYYYQAWLVQIPDRFPTAAIIAILFGLVTSYSPVRTLLKEADLVFLLPAEHKMDGYFWLSLLYSFLIQLYLVLLIAAALGPLYFATYPNKPTTQYLVAIVVLLVLKVWSLLANWWMLKIRDRRTRVLDTLIRLVLTIVIFYFFVKGEMVLSGIVTILLFGLFIYNYFLSRQYPGIAWDLLVEKDRERMHTFYRIANMFTDVPQLKTAIKKRHSLVAAVTSRINFSQEQSYHYLYRITFIRSGDYLGMYLRLIIIGGLCIYFIPNLWMKIVFSLLFLYLSGFQMMTLWQHHRTIAWLDLYPLKKEWRQAALVKWLMQLMIVQTIIFGLLFVFIGNLLGLAVVWIGGFLFSYVFIHGFVKKRLV
ncbi:ABC transporter permease [Aquibacillus salsiterrae]|uniref:ABC transporter permease n=1 Tax=Aquibacillus salsiterrae TaxID=2950439 RepID=A0A9X4AEW9_9BACI|nr:ABC transporter permease [Aquibacillus salsiterrae]MDC3417266.1 ABC transporter permease [Aquibacillus salsiterrae]